MSLHTFSPRSCRAHIVKRAHKAASSFASLEQVDALDKTSIRPPLPILKRKRSCAKSRARSHLKLVYLPSCVHDDAEARLAASLDIVPFDIVPAAAIVCVAVAPLCPRRAEKATSKKAEQRWRTSPSRLQLHRLVPARQVPSSVAVHPKHRWCRSRRQHRFQRRQGACRRARRGRS